MGANGENLFTQTNNLIYPYPVVNRSLALGSSTFSPTDNPSTTATASALILLNGDTGKISGQFATISNDLLSINTGRAALIVNQRETQDILTASASGITKMKLDIAGNMYFEKFVDIGNSSGTYYIDPASSTTALYIAGDIISDNTSFSIASTSNQNLSIIAPGTGVVMIGDTTNSAGAEVCITLDGTTCTGKIDAGTVDPPYTIDGKNYATYMPSMTGVKEETTGTIVTNQYISGVGYRAIIDFSTVADGSDLWLFSRVTNLKQNSDQLVVLLSPQTNTRAWYAFDKVSLTLSLFTAKPATISYRLTAPRFDWQEWANIRDPNEQKGFIVDYQSDWWTGSGNGQTPEDPLLHLVIEPLTEPVSGQLFRIRDTQTNATIEETMALSRSLIANLQTGLFTAIEGTINTFTAQFIISPVANINTLQTDTISPLGNNTVSVKLTDQQRFGVINDQNKPVALFDNNGNATLSGNLTVEQDASIAGTLFAKSIIGTFGDLSEKLHTLEEGVASLSAVPLATPSALPPPIIIQSSESAALANAVSVMDGDLVVNTNLFVLGETSLSQTSITGSLLVDGMIHFTQNIIETIGETLYIQKNKLANVDILDGTLIMDIYNRIFVTGDLFVSGNTTVNGVLGVSTIKPTANGVTIDLSTPLPFLEASGSASPSSSFASLLVRGANQTIVASIDASGSARFGGSVTIEGATQLNGPLQLSQNSLGTSMAVAENQTTLIISGLSVESANYSIFVTASWNTSTWVMDKTVHGMTIGFSDPAPVGATVDWLLLLPQDIPTATSSGGFN